MPLLGNEPDIKEVVLPSTKSLPEDQQAKLWFDVSPRKAGDYYNVESNAVGSATFAILMARTKDWNYTDVNGEKLPITVENFGRLNADDFTHLQELLMDIDGIDKMISTDEKKSSSDTSSPAVSVPVESQ